MKRQLTMAVLALAATAMLAACSKKEGYTDGGVRYKFDKLNSSAQQVQEGDVLVGELTVMFDTMQVFNNVGHPERVLQAIPGDPFYEGLILMHVGDKATISVKMDTLAKMLERDQLPEFYEPGKDMELTYTISLQDIITREEIETERINRMQEMEQLANAERSQIASYVEEHGITAQPTASGLYIIVKKQGKGPKVEAGKQVAINYTGTLLDGTMFDSSVESDAKRGNIYQAGAEYKPITYKVGETSLIRGWNEGVMGQPEGTVMQLIIPSNLAYGSMGRAPMIPPYSPLVFDMEIVSVK